MISVVLAATLTVVAWALWTRRHAWGCRWEVAANLTIVFQAAALIFTAPLTSVLYGADFHKIFGIWNVEDYLGHCCYLASATAIVHHGLSRMTHNINSLRLVYYVVVPTMIVLLWLLIPSRGARTPSVDFMALPEGRYLTSYWLVLCSVTAAILTYGLILFVTLWREPRHRRTATIYIFGTGMGILTCLARIVQAVTSETTIAMSAYVWLGVCVAVAGFSLAFGWSWRRRQTVLTEARPLARLGSA